MNTMETILNRRSVRSYTEEKVCREKVEQLVNAGLHAPTAMNRQTFQITVVEKPELLAKLADAVKAAMNIQNVYNFYGAKTLFLLSDSADKELGQMDCACVAENILLAAYDLELGACWINQFRNTSDDPTVRALLTEVGVPAAHRVWLGIALGNPTEWPEAKERVAKVVYCE